MEKGLIAEKLRKDRSEGRELLYPGDATLKSALRLRLRWRRFRI